MPSTGPKSRSLCANSEAWPLYWAVVAQDTHGASYLLFMPLVATSTGDTVFQRLQEKYEAVTRTTCREHWLVRLMTKTVVGTAIIIWVKGSTSGSQQYTRVTVENIRDDKLLTEAFHNPTLFSEEKTYALDNIQFAVDPLGKGQTWYGQEVVLLRRVYDKQKIAWLLIFMLLGAPLVGTAIGKVSHEADVGVAVTGAVVTSAAFSLALLAWMEV